MTMYLITSRAGHDFGRWDADSPAEALMKQHQDAGYNCRLNDEGDDVAFDDEEDARLCGFVKDWHIAEEPTFDIGDTVEGGDIPEDFDVGTIHEINLKEGLARVGWKSGVKTWTPIADLRDHDD